MRKIGISALALAVPLSALALYRTVGTTDAVPAGAVMASATAAVSDSTCTVRLSVDQKLEAVAWRCEAHGRCVPWYLTRTAQAKEAAESYLVWSPDEEVRCLVSENRDRGAWKTEENTIIRLSIEQRLVSVGWECASGRACELRFLTRLMRGNEQPRGHTFSDGVTSYSIFESR